MRILYVGDCSPLSTSGFRAAALRRLGHEVETLDISTSRVVGSGRIWNKVHFLSGYKLLQSSVQRMLRDFSTLVRKFDVAWVDSGELLGLDAVLQLKQISSKVVLYNHDDPTGPRDWQRFASLRTALPAYDLCCVVRHENVDEFRNLGAPHVLRVWRSYDETGHSPFLSLDDIPSQFRSEVSFVGAMIPGEGRDEFMVGLIRRGVPVSIWGSNWRRSRFWSELEHCYRGSKMLGREYVAAIQGAKISIGLLSKGNRDLHTTRSLEIPYIGSTFCAERTREHIELFKDGVEATFWSSVDECADVCLELLGDENRRRKIANAGAVAVRQLGVGNEDICRNVLQAG
ncbi:glycosyltransferase [uncultured Sphaerotilus sp.]|uniref:CgeB family protein n=1 Tax=uncultured Sphaerotilus sp. TaxID=474984 RepID=UPI0030CA2CE1